MLRSPCATAIPGAWYMFCDVVCVHRPLCAFVNHCVRFFSPYNSKFVWFLNGCGSCSSMSVFFCTTANFVWFVNGLRFVFKYVRFFFCTTANVSGLWMVCGSYSSMSVFFVFCSVNSKFVWFVNGLRFVSKYFPFFCLLFCKQQLVCVSYPSMLDVASPNLSKLSRKDRHSSQYFTQKQYCQGMAQYLTADRTPYLSLIHI